MEIKIVTIDISQFFRRARWILHYYFTSFEVTLKYKHVRHDRIFDMHHILNLMNEYDILQFYDYFDHILHINQKFRDL